MAPGNQQPTNTARSYGSLRNDDLAEEEGKRQSFSDGASTPTEPQQGYDMEQMRLIVSSLRQKHHQENQSKSTTATLVPPFTPDEYYYQESRQQWRRTWAGILGGLLAGWLLTKGWSTVVARNGKPLQQELDLEGSFDYIVVGGGPSGIMTAFQLAKKLPTAKVVLLESGLISQSAVLESLNQNHPKQQTTNKARVDLNGNLHASSPQQSALNSYDIPIMWAGVSSTQRRSQSFGVEPDPHASTYWPIPLALLVRGLGGCGLHNAMIYIRSLPSCFDRWNMTGWAFDQMLPVYESLETYTPIPLDNSTALPPHRGREGPIRTTPSLPGFDNMGDYFVQAAQASGLPLAGERQGAPGRFNGVHPEDRIGAGYYEFNTRNGVRDSVANALLGNTKEIPPNLRVVTGATVTQVLWSNAHPNRKPKAAGVTYLDATTGNRANVWLHSSAGTIGEVLLATGAIMTPQILWNSGVGDGGSLVHLPGVGKNLQDHPVLGMAYEITPEMTESAPQMYALADEMEDYKMAAKVLNDMEDQQQQEQTSSSSQDDAKRWAFEKLGILGTPGFSAGAFLKSPWAEEGGPPDIQLTVFPRVIEPHQPKSKRQIDVEFMRARAMLVTVALLEPEARYEVKPSDLQSLESHATATAGSAFASALQYPLPSIRLPLDRRNYLTDKDVKRLAWGMEQVRQILKYPPMANVTTTELYPGESVVNTDGHNILGSYIQSNHLANSHWVGSTKMGRDDDPLAVLDESLRVRGVEGLRVMDSGAIPKVPNGNTHSTVCAVASRGVDLIVAERESHS